MPWRLLPLAVQLLPVYCLILVFVSAIKFFLVFICYFGCFKIIAAKDWADCAWFCSSAGGFGYFGVIFQGEMFFLFCCHPWKTNPPLTLHFCHPWGLKWSQQSSLQTNMSLALKIIYFQAIWHLDKQGKESALRKALQKYLRDAYSRQTVNYSRQTVNWQWIKVEYGKLKGWKHHSWFWICCWARYTGLQLLSLFRACKGRGSLPDHCKIIIIITSK